MSSVRARITNYYAIGDTAETSRTKAVVSGSMAADITGPITQISNLDQICYQVTWTSASAVGVISIQGSTDGVTFYDLTFTPALAQPNSDSGGYLINLALTPFSFIRPMYTRTSGTGSLVMTMSAKGN